MTSQLQPEVQEKRLEAEEIIHSHGKKKKNKKVPLDPTICDEAILRDLVKKNFNLLSMLLYTIIISVY